MADALTAQQTADAATQRWQRAALERIGRLLEALKSDEDMVARSPSDIP